MNDTPQAPEWWQATDGKWYPPESHPNAGPQLPQTPPQPVQSYHDPAQQSSAAPGKKHKKPIWRRWWAIALGVPVVLIVIAAIAAPPADDAASNNDDVAAVVEATASVATTVDSAPEPESSPEPEPESSPEPEPVGSRDNPVPLGQPANFTMDTFGDADNSEWSITVDAPGSDITQAVLEENQFNEQPDPGTLFYGFPVTFTLNSADKEPLSILFNLTPAFYGPDSLSIIDDGFDEGCGVTPFEFDILKEVFVDGSISGTVCYQVTEADAAGGILLTTDRIEGDRLFMSTR
jgi:hypothetical protein